jgi:predicted transcriptional regulator
MKGASLLDERELQILQALWQHGPLRPSEVQRHLSFPMKNPALRWLLNDLVERGQLQRQRSGKAYVYRPAVQRRPLIATLGRRLREILFGGSALAMIGELVDLKKLSPADIRELQKLAGENVGPRKPKRKPKP